MQVKDFWRKATNTLMLALVLRAVSEKNFVLFENVFLYLKHPVYFSSFLDTKKIFNKTRRFVRRMHWNKTRNLALMSTETQNGNSGNDSPALFLAASRIGVKSSIPFVIVPLILLRRMGFFFSCRIRNEKCFPKTWSKLRLSAGLVLANTTTSCSTLKFYPTIQ